MFFKFKKKNKYPEQAKYKKGDYINFRYREELYFGYVHEAFLYDENKIKYTIQIAGQCPTMIYDYKEEDIIGYKKR